MIHTAEEILEKHLNVTVDLKKWPNGYPYIIEAINEARIEAIKECAEVAEAEMENETYPDGTETANLENAVPIVNKQSILKLLDQIK